MTQKLQLADQPGQPERCSAEKLTPGQYLASGELTTLGPTEVRYVETFQIAQGGRETLIVHRPLGVDWVGTIIVGGNRWFTLAAEADLAEFRAGAERAQKIADIRALADWLEANPDVPMPYQVSAVEHWNENPGDPTPSAAIATIRNLGQMYGVKLDEHLDDRTRFIVPFGAASYELVVWHEDGRPAEPEPLVVPADPFGLAYTRADSEADDPTPVSPARVPMHTGGMTAEGLVDETPAPVWHFSEKGTWTACALLVGGSAFPMDEGWTNTGAHVTCKACLDSLAL